LNPIPGLALAASILQASPAPPSVTEQMPIVIEAKRQHYDAVKQIFVYEDGVVASYGPTTLHADRLTIDRLHQTFDAAGHIQLLDPEGSLAADTLHGNWAVGGSGSEATNIRGEIAGASFRARRAVILPDVWTLVDVEGTTCRRNPPLYSVSSRQVKFYPGRYGKAVHPRISLFGLRLLTLPNQNFNLDTRTEGIQLPSIGIRKDEGLGVSWRAGLLLDRQTALSANLGAFKKSYPTINGVVARSFVPEKDARGLITPGSDLAERFGFGFFESVDVDKPSVETGTLRQLRNTLAIGSTWNQSASGREVSEGVRYSKPVEAIYERNGAFAGWALVASTRLQYIGSQLDHYRPRLLNTVSAGPPSRPIARNFSSLTRFDGATFLGNDAFGWGRITLGVIYRPFPVWSLSAAGIGAVEFGHVELPSDPLTSRNGFVLRSDLNLASTRFSYLQKWDGRLKWFDREYSIYQAVGCLEVFTTYRQFSHDYRFGVKLRVDQFVNLLQRKEFKRTNPPATSPTQASIE
jgi:hypothetical protein